MDTFKAAEALNTVPVCTCVTHPVSWGYVTVSNEKQCPIHAPSAYSLQDVDDESGVGVEEV